MALEALTQSDQSAGSLVFGVVFGKGGGG
jgi:hypothetical protein